MIAIALLLDGCAADGRSERRATAPADDLAALDGDTPGKARRAGRIGNPELTEISGLAASQLDDDLLWALNDGGNPASLYALDHTGITVAEVPLDVPNRDWEDLAAVRRNGVPCLLIADIGDNQARHAHAVIHLVEEPALPRTSGKPLSPVISQQFRYEDGPHDAESLAVADDALWILTKSPAGDSGRQPSALYRLPWPLPASDSPLAVARRVGELGMSSMSLESRVIAALSDVDIDQPTAFDIDPETNVAYTLSYRSVRRHERKPDETWPHTLQRPGRHVLTHSLRQAEALAIGRDGRVWFTTESVRPPLWVIE